MHVSRDVAPISALNLPAAQGTHVSKRPTPMADRYVPALHGAQAMSDAEDVEPGGQVVHDFAVVLKN